MKEAIKELQGKTFYTLQGGSVVECIVCGKVPHPRATFTLLVSFPNSGSVVAMSWKRFIFAEGMEDMHPTKRDLYIACEEFYTKKMNMFKDLAIKEIIKDDEFNNKMG